MGLRQLSLLLCLAAAPVMAQMPATAISVTPQHGAEIFASRGCAFCHGPQLMGTERAPKLLDVRKRLSAEQIAHQIHDGGKNMPAFGEQLGPEEIQALVAFLRSRHPEKLLPRTTTPAH